MQIICISRGSYSQGKELAEGLAAKLGWPCLSREDLVEEATRAGIPVGKLEAAMLKPSRLNERLMLATEHYHAFVTSYLCERALGTSLVYHGRTGHLLLPGITHVLRVRVIEDLDRRINSAMSKMNLTREKARRYLENVDDDMRRWVRTFYGVEWDATSHYDLVLNLEQMSVQNAAVSLCAVAALPDFQTTPASRAAMENLHLAARVRLALASDERTGGSLVRVQAEQGSVLVTYQPRDAQVAEHVPAVLETIDGIAEYRCTMAATNILWIQEEFSAASPAYAQIVALARRWNAAVELLRYLPGEALEVLPALASSRLQAAAPLRQTAANGGIEDDLETPAAADEGGLRRTHDQLALDGVAGGAHVARCPSNQLIDRLDSRSKYNLVVIGDVFLKSGHATRTRKTRELASIMADTLKAPVVGVDELRKTFMFSTGQAVRLALFLALAAGIFGLVFTHQAEILSFLEREGTHARVLSMAGVAVLVPLFAFLYGTVTKNILKLIGIE
jgi:hypothetical protein